MSPTTKKKLLDIGERAAWTYIQTVLGLLVAGQIWSAVDRVGLAKGALAAAIPAGFAVIKGGLATLIGNKDTASTLPASKDPATGG